MDMKYTYEELWKALSKTAGGKYGFETGNTATQRSEYKIFQKFKKFFFF